MGIVLKLQKKRLGELLVEEGLINQEKLKRLLLEQKTSNVRLGKLIIQQGIASEEQIIDIISKQLKIERFNAGSYAELSGLSGFFTAETAHEYNAVPILKKGNLIKVVSPDPLNLKALDYLSELTQLEIDPVICTEKEFNTIIDKVYGSQSGISSGYIETIEEFKIDASVDAETAEQRAKKFS